MGTLQNCLPVMHFILLISTAQQVYFFQTATQSRGDVTNLSKRSSQARSHLYKGHSIPITRLARKSEDGQSHILCSKGFDSCPPWLFTLTGLLSVGAEGQVQLAVQCLYPNKANETPHPSLKLLCEMFRLPDNVPVYQIMYFMLLSNSRQIVCLFGTTQSKQRCL